MHEKKSVRKRGRRRVNDLLGLGKVGRRLAWHIGVIVFLAVGTTGYLLYSALSLKRELAGAQASLVGGEVAVAVAALIAIPLVGILASVNIARRVVRPLRQLQAQAEALAGGEVDLRRELTIDSDDETGQVARAFNRFMGTLRELVGQVTRTATEVSATSEQLVASSEQSATSTRQISDVVEQLAQGAQEQSNSAQSTHESMQRLDAAISRLVGIVKEQAGAAEGSRALMETVGEAVNTLRESTQKLADASAEASESALHGQQRVANTISGFRGISQAVEEVAVAVRELGSRSAKIGEIIQVIDEIADQTNLLALNAAIEAARAGEHGKGFAVVADEVRRLAEKSRQATKEIASIIQTMQQSVATAVASMEKGNEAVAQGTSLVEDMGTGFEDIARAVRETDQAVQAIQDALEGIVGATRKVEETMGRLAVLAEQSREATEEMARSAGTVRQAIETIAAVTEQSAAAAEEASASTEEVHASATSVSEAARRLAGMAETLQQLASRFRV